ncbi:MAG: arginine--tRNA ligase [Candidatus Latescibacterota bacterium]|nr:arginine--tRNA ligase [Candidatus Latescibacterota bacterium]
MREIRSIIEDRIATAMESTGAPERTKALVVPATRPEFGDYQANGIMSVAKKLGKNPRDFAQAVVDSVELNDIAESVDIAGPGFINIRLKLEWLNQFVNEASNDSRVGIQLVSNPSKVVIDYSHPNLAKEMHVGHLRSTVIGDTLARILEFCGHEVIRHNHVGDWGTQFGMLIAYMDRLSKSGEDFASELEDLEAFYQASRKLFDNDDDFAKTAREYVVKLQTGDDEVRSSWKRFVEASLQHCEQVYRLLDVTLKREDVRAESSYNDDLPDIVDHLRKKGLLCESDGAQCVFLEEFRNKEDVITPVIVQKSDGGYLYATTDLAALRYRTKVLEASRLLYIVDARQSLHLRQVFGVSRAADLVPDYCKLEHHPFGTMLGNDGKPFKTRTGGTVKLMELLREAEERSFILIGEKNPDLTESERREISRVIGIGSVKYADLSLNRTTDYVFNWDKMLSLEGNTAPYLLYSCARIKSIFRRAEITEDQLGQLNGRITLADLSERALAVKIVQLNEVVHAVAKECFPNILCTYLYELSEFFMKFYERCPVLKTDDETRISRLKLCKLTGEVLETGLGLLGIGTVRRM